MASVKDWTGRAARMLARDPGIAAYDFRTAVILAMRPGYARCLPDPN